MAKKQIGLDIVEVGTEDSTPGSSSYNVHNPAPEIVPLEDFEQGKALPGAQEDHVTSTGYASGTLLEDEEDNTIRRRSAALPTSSRRPARPTWVQRSSYTAKRRLRPLLDIPVLSHIVKWVRGPSPVTRYHIDPFLQRLQSWPTSVLERYISPTSGPTVAAVAISVLWLIIFIAVLANFKKTSISATTLDAPVRISCITSLWDDSCGLDNRYCQPLKGSSFLFICPSGCADVQITNPYVVGDQLVNYRSLVIGGPGTNNQSTAIYRGDSFICQAAVHAGIVSDTYGGCGILNREGEQAGYTSTDHNGISSIAFQPSFPLAFSFTPSADDCRDPQWYLLIPAVLATVIISMIATSPALFFSSIFAITFFQVALVSDPPWASDYGGVVSTAFGGFIPAAFVATIIYRFSVLRMMKGLTAYWERTVLWLGGLWVGALNAYTFDRIPLSRLFDHDLRQEPGAIVSLIVVVLILFAVAVGQVWAFRKEGRLPHLLLLYIIIGVALGCLSAARGLDVRLHHYIVALLFLPGTNIQTRSSLLYQGILIGLFINGIARWGFASILQETSQLLTGAETGSDLPTGLIPSIVNNTIKFTISKITAGFDGLSIRVNDVETYQMTNASLPVVFNWTRTTFGEDSYFRFAYTGTYATGGLLYGDYTKSGTWLANGTWLQMSPGPS